MWCALTNCWVKHCRCYSWTESHILHILLKTLFVLYYKYSNFCSVQFKSLFIVIPHNNGLFEFHLLHFVHLIVLIINWPPHILVKIWKESRNFFDSTKIQTTGFLIRWEYRLIVGCWGSNGWLFRCPLPLIVHGTIWIITSKSTLFRCFQISTIQIPTVHIPLFYARLLTK